ncbi:MAG TPA: hypothetical protein VIF57_18475 [Polyangia bacterium]|jgi:hypothetical protein
MIAALPLLALLAASPPAVPAPVILRGFDCPRLNETDVRHALTVELHDRLLQPSAPAPAAFLAIEIACPADGVEVTVVRGGETALRARRISGDGGAGRAGARTVALAAAELVRSAESPPPPPPAPPAVERVAAPAAEAAGDVGPAHLWAIGPVASAFTSGSTLLAGAEVRWTYLWAKLRGHPTSPWSFGPSLAFDALAASFWSGNGDLAIGTVTAMTMAQRQAGHLRPELGLGLRLGVARFSNETGPDRTADHAVGGGVVMVGLAYVTGRTYVRAALQGALPVLAPGRFCSTSACVDFEGGWLLASLALGLGA